VFLRRLALRAHGIIERLDRQAHQTVLRRLAAHLLARRAASKGTGGSRGAISLGMTQTQLAEELGTVKEVIVRELRTLRRLRLIEPAQRGLYRVTDAAALARLAELA
jgi:CRP/FNR family transcriptional regulator